MVDHASLSDPLSNGVSAMLDEDVDAWPRLRILVRRSWAEDMRGDWRHHAKSQLTEAAGLGDKQCFEVVGVHSCREEMEIFEDRPTIRGRNGFEMPAIGNFHDVSWYGELAQFRETAFVAELVFSPAVGLSIQEVSQILENQLGLCARRNYASEAFNNLRNLMPRGARHMYLVPARPKDAPERRTTIAVLEESLSLEDEMAPEANNKMAQFQGIDVHEAVFASSCGFSPVPLSCRSASPGSNVLAINSYAHAQVPSESDEDEALRLKVESARVACRETVRVEDFVLQQAIVHGREFTNWPRVRIPVRAAFFQRFGDVWMAALKDCLSKFGGLRQWPQGDLEVVAIRSLQDEMLLFENRPATRCSPHHNAPDTVDREAKIPAVARLKDAQWYGQLAYIRQPAVVVEIALSTNINQNDFVQALSAELTSSNIFGGKHRPGRSPFVPLQHPTDISGVAIADVAESPVDQRFASLHVQDVVPNETRQVYTFPPAVVHAGSPQPRQVLQKNPWVGRQLRLGVGACSETLPRAVTAPSTPLRSRRPRPPGSARNLGTTGVRVWQGPAGICAPAVGRNLWTVTM